MDWSATIRFRFVEVSVEVWSASVVPRRWCLGSGRIVGRSSSSSDMGWAETRSSGGGRLGPVGGMSMSFCRRKL